MADASNLQTSFLGGEWSKSSQGRADQPGYETALNLCRNGLPIEEGAWTRRSGDRYAQCSRFGRTGKLVDFNWTQAQPWTIEFTDGFVRLFVGAGGLLMDPSPQGLSNISTASPAVFTLGNTVTWNVGDFVMVSSSDKTRGSNLAPLRNRQFVIATKSGNTVTLTDPYTGAAINGSGITFDHSDTTMQMTKVFELTSPYTSGTWKDIKVVQIANPDALVLFHPTLPPYILAPAAGVVPGALSQAGFTGSFGTFTLTQMVFVDGPYLDPVNGSVATPGGTSGVISFAIAFQTWSSSTTYASGAFVTSSGTDYVSLVDSNLNNTPASSPSFWQPVGTGSAVGPNGFQNTDIGRSIRIHSEPPLWVAAQAYAVGANVTYNGAYYTAITANTNAQPDVNLSDWLPSPAVATWTWGRIVSINSASSVQLQIVGPALLYTGASVVQTWRLGAFTATPRSADNQPVWPRCGAFHESRLWLGGAIPNRVDSSNIGGTVIGSFENFAPTLADGTVTDASAISAIFNSKQSDLVLWMEPDHIGLICGTQGAEWLVQASQLGDPITPTSIQAHRQTKYGSSALSGAVPVRATNSLMFIERWTRKIMEFVSDAFTTRFMGRNLTEKAKHLTAASGGIQEITYTAELVPTIWARIGDGSWIGCTYRRDSTFTTEPPVMMGWHRHDFGSGRTVESLTSGPSVDGSLDTVAFITNQTNQSDPQANIRHVTYLSNVFQETDDIYHAAFVDDALAPVSCSLTGTAPNYTSITFYGLWHLNGESVAVFAAGQDLGNFTIANGQVTVPFSGTFTFAALQTLSALITPLYNYGSLAVEIDIPSYTTSGVTSPETMTSYLETNSSGTNNNGIIDVVNQKISMTNNGFVTQFAIGNQTQLRQVSISSLSINGMNAPFAVDKANNWYFIDQSPSLIKQLNTTFTTTQSVATASGFNGSSPSGVRPGNANGPGFITVQAGATTFLINSTTFIGGGTEINAVRCDTMAFAGHVFAPSENCSNAVTTASWQGNGYAWAHTLSGGASGGDSVIGLYATLVNAYATTWNPATWPTQNAGITTTRIASITPSQIDATWTLFNAPSLMAYDSTDGNLLAYVTTAAAVTHTQYMVKINAVTGAIIWKTAVPNNDGGPGNMNFVRIQAGTFTWLSQQLYSSPVSHTNLYTINTITGVITTTLAINGVTAPVLEGTDDKNGLLAMTCTYNSAISGAPTPVGSTTSFSFRYGQLILGTNLTGIKTQGAVVFPTGIGFPFTSQAQRLRQITPGTSGARNGPSLGKTRRNHKFSVLLSQTQGISFGTTFSDPTLTLIPARFLNPNGTVISPLILFSGVFRDTVEARYDYDNMLCWQITRPYPAIVVAAGDFVHTQDL